MRPFDLELKLVVSCARHTSSLQSLNFVSVRQLYSTTCNSHRMCWLRDLGLWRGHL